MRLSFTIFVGPSKRDSPQPPPPGVNRIELVPREEANAAAAELEARSSGSRDQLEEGEDDCDSGVESLDSLTREFISHITVSS